MATTTPNTTTFFNYLSSEAAKVAARLDQAAQTLDDAWQIPADEAALLHQIALASCCTSILEIGVSYGFSTLHWTHAMSLQQPNPGIVHAIDAAEKKIKAATANLSEAGLSSFVKLHLGKAQDVLHTLRPERPFDLFFIDAVKSECQAYLESALPHLNRRQCIIITDNAITHADELAPFLHFLRSQKYIISSTTIPVGNGFEFSILRM